MKIHEQNDELKNCLADVVEAITLMRCAVIRKCSMPYGDGSRSNMVNADTDVLPKLERMRNDIWDMTHRTGIVLPSTVED